MQSRLRKLTPLPFAFPLTAFHIPTKLKWVSQDHNYYLSAAKGGQIVQKGCARDPVCSGVCVSRSHTMPYDKISIFKLGKFFSKCLFYQSNWVSASVWHAWMCTSTYCYFRIVKLHRDYVRKILHVLMQSHYFFFFYWSWLHWCNLNSKMAF